MGIFYEFAKTFSTAIDELHQDEEEAGKMRQQERARKRNQAKNATYEKMVADNEWWQNLEKTNEWETRILPEGWNIFGQTSFPVITEYYKD